jgi:multidrug efflux system outer membrane protein
MKKLVLALLVAAPVAPVAPVALSAQNIQQIPVVTLDDALRIAAENATTMRNARNSLRSSRMTVTQRYAAFLPSISTNASFQPAQNGAPARYGAGISASISGMFNQNTYFQIAQAKRALANQEASYVATQFQLKQTVKQQYFQVLQAREALTASRNALRVQETNMEWMRERVRTGTTIESDTLNQMQSLLSSQLNVVNGERSVENLIRTFSRTLGLENDVQPDPGDTANFRMVELDSAALVAMLPESPQAVQSRTTHANAKQSLLTAKLVYLPQLSGGINWSRSGSGEGLWGYGSKTYRYNGGEPSISFSIGLPFFDRFGRESGLVSAREALENAEIAMRDQRLNQHSTLINNLNSVRTTVEQMRINELQIAAAERSLEVATLRYELDLDTSLQVLNAQNSLFTARNSLISTRNTYRNQIAQIETLVGRELR